MKQEINWISCKERLPEMRDIYLVLVKHKYDYEKEWNYVVDVAQNYGYYIDNYWDTFNDWIEGQGTHVIYWAEIPYPEDLIKKEVS